MQRSSFPLAIVITTFIALSSTAALAQTSGAAEFKRRIATQLATSTHTPTEEAGEAAAQSAAPFTAQQGGILDVLERQKKALLGTWNLTLIFGDGSQVKSTLSVAPGRGDEEGTVLHSAEASLLLPNPTTSEQGVWQYTGGLQFIASYRGYAVDEKFQNPAGTIGFRHAITVNSDQETFTGRAVFEVRDADGNVVFSDTLQTRGVRQRAVAP